MIELSKETQQYVHKSDEERFMYISKELWIEYPIATDILQKMEQLLKYEKNKSRVTSMLLVGSGNNGKTSLLERFEALHPPYDYNLASERPDWVKNDFFDAHSGVGRPVLYVIAPPEPSESRLYSNILNMINAPHKERDPLARKQYLVEYYLKIFNVEMLIIDEIHGVLSGSVLRQKQIMNAIKNLSNALQIPIVLAGTKSALRAINTDTQISSRFRPAYLTKWKMGPEFVNLLATILTLLPLRKESDILNQKVALMILEKSEGYIGEIFGILRAAAVYAITSKSEKITIKEIEECNYLTIAEAHKNETLKDV